MPSVRVLSNPLGLVFLAYFMATSAWLRSSFEGDKRDWRMLLSILKWVGFVGGKT